MNDRVETIKKAAQWLATTPETQRSNPLIPHMQVEFGLTLQEAMAAIREAHLIRARAL